MGKIGRNAPCPCGSGKKYKKCCLEKEKKSVSGTRNESSKNSTSLGQAGRADAQLSIRPYVLSKFCEPDGYLMQTMAQEEPHMREKVTVIWVPSRVRALSTEKIIAELANRGIPYDEQRFLKTTQSMSSAWDVAETLWQEQMEMNTKDVSDFCGLVACILWERLYEAGKIQKVSFEMLDDLIEEGYEFFTDSPQKTCDIWLRGWACVKTLFHIPGKTIDEMDDQFNGGQSLLNLCTDMEMSFINASTNNRDTAHKGIRFLEEFLLDFPDEDDLLLGSFRVTLAELYCRVGDQEAGEQLMREEIEGFPSRARGYVGMEIALSYRTRNGRPPAYAEQLQILEKARQNRVVDGDEYDLNLRIRDLRTMINTHIEKEFEQIMADAPDRATLDRLRKRMNEGTLREDDYEIIRTIVVSSEQLGKVATVDEVDDIA
jgi:hypothetical protein